MQLRHIPSLQHSFPSLAPPASAQTALLIKIHSFPSDVDSSTVAGVDSVRYSGDYERYSASVPPAKLKTAALHRNVRLLRVSRRSLRQGGPLELSPMPLPRARSTAHLLPSSWHEHVHRHLTMPTGGAVDISNSHFRSPPSLWRLGCNAVPEQRGASRSLSQGSALSGTAC
jgi:hypothetical protein